MSFVDQSVEQTTREGSTHQISRSRSRFRNVLKHCGSDESADSGLVTSPLPKDGKENHNDIESLAPIGETYRLRMGFSLFTRTNISDELSRSNSWPQLAGEFESLSAELINNEQRIQRSKSRSVSCDADEILSKEAQGREDQCGEVCHETIFDKTHRKRQIEGPMSSQSQQATHSDLRQEMRKALHNTKLDMARNETMNDQLDTVFNEPCQEPLSSMFSRSVVDKLVQELLREREARKCTETERDQLIQQAQTVLSTFQREIVNIQRINGELVRDKDELVKDKRELVKDKRVLQQYISQLTQQNDRLNQEVTGLRNDSTQLTSSQNQEVRQLRRQLGTAANKLCRYKEEKEDLKKEICLQKLEIGGLKKKLANPGVTVETLNLQVRDETAPKLVATEQLTNVRTQAFHRPIPSVAEPLPVWERIIAEESTNPQTAPQFPPPSSEFSLVENLDLDTTQLKSVDVKDCELPEGNHLVMDFKCRTCLRCDFTSYENFIRHIKICE